MGDFRALPYFRSGPGISLYSPSLQSENVGDDRALTVALVGTVEPTGIDDTAAIQAVLTAGLSVNLIGGETYYLKSRVSITANDTGIEGNGATIVMDTGVGNFDNATFGSYGADAVGISAVGTSGARIERPFVRNARIQPSAWVDEVYLKPVHFEYCSDIDISGNDIGGFSRGDGLITVNNIDDGRIAENYLHDCWTDSTDADPQITGITVDPDADSLTDLHGRRYASRGLHIVGNTIRNLTLGEAARTALNYQTDGIHLASANNATASSAKPTRDCVIELNVIENIGEGIDIQGHGNVIRGNAITRAFASGVKLVHGASDNLIAGNVLTDIGGYGVVLQPSNTVGAIWADGNVIEGNVIRRLNQAYDWLSADETVTYDSTGGTVAPYVSGSAGVRIEVVNGWACQIRNTLISGNDIDCGSGAATIGIFAEGNAGGSATHRAVDNVIRNAASAHYTDTQGYLLIQRIGGNPSVTVAAATATVGQDETTIIVDYAGACALTLPTAHKGRKLRIVTKTANTVASASANVVPLAGGAAGSAILSASAGKWADLEGNGSNWDIVAGN